jgi:hypothetical protein
MNSDQERVLDKIKKLLRMKRGGTEGEIETALALAAELARKHGINLDSVDPDAEPAQRIGHIDATTSARIQWECKYAGLVCERFNVSLLVRQSRKVKVIDGWPKLASDYMVTFTGVDRDIQMALYVYHFLVRHFRHCWNKRRGRCRNRQAFLYGMYHGLCSKLDEQRKQQQLSEAGLVFVGRQVALRTEYERAHFGESKQQSSLPDGDADAAKVAGYLAGRSTEIRSGIGSNGQASLLLQEGGQ